MTDDDTSTQDDTTPEPGAGDCPCGRTHRITPDIARMIAANGPTVIMRGSEGAWHVPRAYAAAHNVTAGNLPRLAEEHGFDPA